MRSRAPIVISRKPGQGIVIGDTEITVLEIRGQTVKIGVRVTRGTTVYRSEKRIVPSSTPQETEGPDVLPDFLRNRSGVSSEWHSPD